MLVGDFAFSCETKLKEAGLNVNSVTVSEDKKSVKVVLAAAASDENVATVNEVMAIADNYGGMVSDGGPDEFNRKFGNS